MYTIRKGGKKDLPKVLDLVLELAIFENEPDAVTATLADYETSLADQTFEFQVAEAEGEIIGLILYYMCFSTWKGKMLYLEDFVVTQSWRRKGVGEALFQAFIKASEEKQAALSKWQVLDWNESAINFYKKQTAIIESEWLNCKIFNP